MDDSANICHQTAPSREGCERKRDAGSGFNLWSLERAIISYVSTHRSATMRSRTAIILYSSTKYCMAQRHDHLIGVETLLHCDPFVCDDMSTEHC